MKLNKIKTGSSKNSTDPPFQTIEKPLTGSI